MLKKALFAFICGLVLSPSLCFAAGTANTPPDFSEMIHQAGNLARQGEWDRSEIYFLKASESPVPDHRVQAYEGLTELYKRLRLLKKSNRAQKRLEDEKKFIAWLVPQGEKYYKTHVLKSGDSYAKIAAREKISLEWIKRANQNKNLIIGKTVRIPLFSYNLKVNQKKRTMTWMRGNEILKVYPVAIGKKETQTPRGEFEIISKVKKPIWYHLKLKIPPDSPKNLLGTRWMGLNVKGYGIHGTRDPKSIQYAVSHGCVRMYNRDVEELFEWIPVGTKVTIEETL